MSVDSQWWWCYREGVNRQIDDIMYGVVKSGAKISNVRARHASAPPKTAAEYWEAIAANQPTDRQQVIEHWARHVREWPESIVSQVIHWPQFRVFDRALHSQIDHKVSDHIMRDGSYRILAAVRDGDDKGSVRRITRIWDGTEPDPKVGGKRRRLDVSTGLLATSRDGASIFGRVWLAARNGVAHGNPIFMTEGLPDTVGLYGLIGKSGVRASVIGAWNTDKGRAAECLRTSIIRETLSVSQPRIPHVYIIRQADKSIDSKGNEITPAAETWADACYDKLSNHAIVTIINVWDLGRDEPYDQRGDLDTYDLADWLKERGDGASLDELMGSRHIIVKTNENDDKRRPFLLGKARSIVPDSIRESIGNVVKPHKRGESLGLIIVPPGVGKSAAALEVAAEIADGQSPVGIPVSGSAPDEGDDASKRRVAFLMSNHLLCDEKRRDFDSLYYRGGCGTPSLHIKGMLKECAYATGRSGVMTSVFKSMRGKDQVCEGCDRIRTCKGYMPDKPEFGSVAFAHYDANLDVDLAFYDEDPGIETMRVLEMPELLSLAQPGRSRSAKVLFKSWEGRNPEARDIVTALHTAIVKAAVESGANNSKYEKNLNPAMVKEIVDSCGLTMSEIMRGFSDDISRPHLPSPAEIRSGGNAVTEMVSPFAWDVVRDLLRWAYPKYFAGTDDGITDLDDGLNGTSSEPVKFDVHAYPRPFIVIGGGANHYRIEMRDLREFKVPSIVLDATAVHHLDRWKRAHEMLEVHQINVAPNFPLKSIWLRSSSMNRKAAIEGSHVSPSCGGDLRDIFDRMLEMSPELKSGDTIGIITHKRIAEATGKYGDVSDPSWSDKRKAEAERKAAPVKAAVDHLESLGFKIKVGHYFRDERGTNAFEEVDAFLILGDPYPSIAESERRAHQFDLDGEEIQRSEMRSIIVQAIARSRFAVRHRGHELKLLLYCGNFNPSEAQDLSWERVDVEIQSVNSAFMLTAMADLMRGNPVSVRKVIVSTLSEDDIEALPPEAIRDETVSRMIDRAMRTINHNSGDSTVSTYVFNGRKVWATSEDRARRHAEAFA